MTYIANILTINYLTGIVISVKILGFKFRPYIAEHTSFDDNDICWRYHRFHTNPLNPNILWPFKQEKRGLYHHSTLTL